MYRTTIEDKPLQRRFDKLNKDDNYNTSSIEFSSQSFLGCKTSVKRIKKNIVIRTNEHMYRPKHIDFRYDWVNRVAIPAFHAAHNNSSHPIKFCTIGTGAGADALAAIEIFNPSKVLVTDIHEDVVDLAVRNITNNINDVCSTKIHGSMGMLAKPVQEEDDLYDLIYENLPNIPLSSNDTHLDGTLSSTFYKSSDNVPGIIKQNLLELHQRFLIDAHSCLTEDGSILCSIGARRPIDDILKIIRSCNYDADPLIYTWKFQSEPFDVISGYASYEKEGYGPFNYYPVEVLDRIFEDCKGIDAAQNWRSIEKSLAEHALDTKKALGLVNQGCPVGHTVVAINAKPRR